MSALLLIRPSVAAAILLLLLTKKNAEKVRQNDKN